ncbi:MAG: DNA methyltransferase [Anaerolineae bacterium]|nr:DNA methyltransferase [Anaerolineae bacterium]
MQLPLFDISNLSEEDWTFSGAPTRTLTHCYHDYPARMIPQVAARLLERFAPQPAILFDPYCGTGTSLVEGLIRGHEAHGTDLNPLARLISRAKTAPLSLEALDAAVADLEVWLRSPMRTPERLPTGIDLAFWFQPQAIEQLAHVRAWLDQLADDDLRAFFAVAFSETVRECSNTRPDEFKLYRLPQARLRTHTPDVFNLLRTKIARNREGLCQFLAAYAAAPRQSRAHIHAFNSVQGIPLEQIAPESVQIVVTSPPYGDSRTTVAYGQFSRLAAEWLGLPEAARVDRALMGGTSLSKLPNFHVPLLDLALQQIYAQAPRRALEVAAFYADLRASITNVASIMARNGIVCYVVGNRSVKGARLPTDHAIQRFFEALGFAHVVTYQRAIPNKRMPLRNSPSNRSGATAVTMTHESVVVMRKV